MTETGAPRSPEQPPPASPALVRAARLNAANMARSLLPLVLICLLFAGWAAFRQAPDERVIVVDPTSSVRLSAERAGYEVLVPTGLPDGYRPTSARTTAGGAEDGEPVTLEIGYLTPDEEFAGFVITDDREADPLRRVLDGAEEQGAEEVGGRTWERRSTARGETAFVLEDGDVTAVVFGSAPDDELAEVAGSVEPYSG